MRLNSVNNTQINKNINIENKSVSRSPFSVTSLNAVLSAIQEFDLIGRYVFLKKYGFRKSVSYLLVHNGRQYDTKAIIGVAFGYQHNKTPLTNNEFSGGKATVEKALIKMGFNVVNIKK